MSVVLDADLLIGALDRSDPHHRAAQALLRLLQERNEARYISVVNLSEVLVVPAAHREHLGQAREAIAALGVAVHQPGEPVGVEAAKLRQRHPISLPDAYCLATAKRLDSAIASFDRTLLRAATAEGVPHAKGLQ